jgi:hypothetical protein
MRRSAAAGGGLAASVVEGKTVAEALWAAPLLFALCGTAQKLACIRAIKSARGDAVPAGSRRATRSSHRGNPV